MKSNVRKWLAITLVATLAVCGILFAQNPNPNIPNQSLPHYAGGIFYAPSYATYSAAVLNTLTGTGSQTYIVGPPTPLRDGTNFGYNMATLFNTNTPLTFGDASSEVVTPTSVSIGPCPTSVTTGGPSGGALCASITASFSNAHGQGTKVFSGDNGIEEAITDAGNLGGGLVYWQVDTGIVTLNTGGLTTTTTTKVPTNFYNLGAAARVTTTITTSTNWAVGISGATSIFCSANATLTAGTTCLANQASPASTGTTSSLTAVLFTVTGANAGAGAVKARVWGWTPVQSAN